jgi:hypothetical protein
MAITIFSEELAARRFRAVASRSLTWQRTLQSAAATQEKSATMIGGALSAALFLQR